MWLVLTVVTQLASALPPMQRDLPAMVAFWRAGAQALLLYALALQAPGRLSLVNALPGIGLFTALHGAPALGGSPQALAQAYVVSRGVFTM